MLGTFVILDERFPRLVPAVGGAEVLHDGGTFTEGPVWFADHQCLLWSDIPANRIMRLTTRWPGQRVPRRTPSHTNGNTRDREGRLVTCEHSDAARDAHRDRRHHHGAGRQLRGQAAQLAQRCRGAAPTVRSGSPIPTTACGYHVPDGVKDQAHDNVFRIDPASGALTAVATDFDKPNGLAFSPDESLLYVADSAITDGPGRNSHIRRFRVNADGTLSGGEVFATTIGIPDGMRVDIAGNVWASAGAKIDVYAPDATLLGQIVGFPAPVTNLTFGGPLRRPDLRHRRGVRSLLIETAIRGAQTP